ncbi:MAG: hypothetical protein HY044_04000 [Candidatus Woesebacteria bacterium]|nr:MAG: hypothetical protein HY044_04000 [Candidatus Woesebacteria bacterium]
MKNQSILVSILIIILFLGVSFFAFNFFSGRISSLTSQIDASNSEQKKLQEKISILQAASKDILASGEIVTLALPADNPMVYVVSQIKRYSQDLNLKVTNIRTTDIGTKSRDLLKSTVELNVTGPYQGTISLLEKVRRSFPLTIVDKVTIDPLATEFRATIDISSYWASFPEKIPALTETITALSSSESATLSQISSFDKPQFVELPPASASGARANPFAP